MTKSKINTKKTFRWGPSKRGPTGRSPGAFRPTGLGLKQRSILIAKNGESVNLGWKCHNFGKGIGNIHLQTFATQ